MVEGLVVFVRCITLLFKRLLRWCCQGGRSIESCIWSFGTEIPIIN